jgi:hypothetical protein
MNVGPLGAWIKDFNDLHIVKEKVRPHETLALFYRVIVHAGLPNRRIQSLFDCSLDSWSGSCSNLDSSYWRCMFF